MSNTAARSLRARLGYAITDLDGCLLAISVIITGLSAKATTGNYYTHFKRASNIKRICRPLSNGDTDGNVCRRLQTVGLRMLDKTSRSVQPLHEVPIISRYAQQTQYQTGQNHSNRVQYTLLGLGSRLGNQSTFLIKCARAWLILEELGKWFNAHLIRREPHHEFANKGRELVNLGGKPGFWRPRPESNRGARICSPLRNHSAMTPCLVGGPACPIKHPAPCQGNKWSLAAISFAVF